MSTPMEVNHGLKGNGSFDVFLGLRGCELLGCSIVAVVVRLMVVLVVKLHDLSGNGRLKRTIVIYKPTLALNDLQKVDFLQLLTWKVWKSRLAADEARSRQAGSSLRSSRSKGCASSRSSSEERSRHD